MLTVVDVDGENTKVADKRVASEVDPTHPSSSSGKTSSTDARRKRTTDDVELYDYELLPLLSAHDEDSLRDTSTTNGNDATKRKKELSFWVDCWERQACLFRRRRRSSDEDLNAAAADTAVVGGMTGFTKLLQHTSGSWLLEELDHSKRALCNDDEDGSTSIDHAKKDGCRWGDGSTLPLTYFQGHAGKKSLEDIRGSVSVQDDVVAGDTMSKTVAEDLLLSYVRGKRGVKHTRSFVGEKATIEGKEWLEYAETHGLTLIVRDADARSGPLAELAAAVQAEFLSPEDVKMNPQELHLPQPRRRRAAQRFPFARPGGGADVGISVYYTPPNRTSTVPPHIDTMDVLVVQEVGTKRWTLAMPHPDYYLPAQSVTLPLSHRVHYYHHPQATTTTSAASRGAETTTRTVEVEIRQGDMLYIPRGMIHNTSTTMASGKKETDDKLVGSLHVSIGLETSPQFTVASFLLFNSRDAQQQGTVMASTTTFAVTGGDLHRAIWGDVPPSAVWTLQRSLGRALLGPLTKRLVSLRRGLLVPRRHHRSDSTTTTESDHTVVHRQLQERLDAARRDVFAYLTMPRRPLDASSSTDSHSSPKNAIDERQRFLTKRRWLRLLRDGIGSASILRSSSDDWWWVPTTTPSSGRGTPPGPGGFAMEEMIGTLSSVIADRLHHLLEQSGTSSSEDSDVNFYEELVNELLLGDGVGLFPQAVLSSDVVDDCGSNSNDDSCASTTTDRAPVASTTTSSTVSLWARWLDQMLQHGHERRLAFAEWTWINSMLMATGA